MFLITLIHPDHSTVSVHEDAIDSLQLAIGSEIWIDCLGAIEDPPGYGTPSVELNYTAGVVTPSEASRGHIRFTIPAKGRYHVGFSDAEDFEFMVGRIPPAITIQPLEAADKGAFIAGHSLVFICTEHSVPWDASSPLVDISEGTPQVLSGPFGGVLQDYGSKGVASGIQIIATTAGTYQVSWLDQTFSLTIAKGA